MRNENTSLLLCDLHKSSLSQTVHQTFAHTSNQLYQLPQLLQLKLGGYSVNLSPSLQHGLFSFRHKKSRIYSRIPHILIVHTVAHPGMGDSPSTGCKLSRKSLSNALLIPCRRNAPESLGLLLWDTEAIPGMLPPIGARLSLPLSSW